MNFITIDFESATSKRGTPCEIGLTLVENSTIIETKTWLIKPVDNKFEYFNMLVHGIRPEDVADKPEFDQLWEEIKPLIEGKFLIAHNASYDMSVLRKTLESYQLPFPKLNYACSYIMSKKFWQGLPGYDLKTLCNLYGIEFAHHRAGPDTRATAELTLKIFELAKISSLAELPSKFNIVLGEIYEGGYKPCETKQTRKPYAAYTAQEVVGDPEKNNPDSIFYGRTVVFTGLLSSMTRTEAHQTIADIGGIIGKGVTKATDYLIVGQQDFKIVGDSGMSTKQKKAIELIKQGSSIEVMSEAMFLQNI